MSAVLTEPYPLVVGERVYSEGDEVLAVSDCDLQTHCKIDPDLWIEQRDLIRGYALAAQQEAEAITGRAIGPGVFRATVSGPVSNILLTNAPISQIVSVLSGVTPVAYTQTLYHGLPLLTFAAPASSFVVEYRAGYEGNVPKPIWLWILMRVAAIVRQPESDSEKPAVPSPYVERMLEPFTIRLILK